MIMKKMPPQNRPEPSQAASQRPMNPAAFRGHTTPEGGQGRPIPPQESRPQPPFDPNKRVQPGRPPLASPGAQRQSAEFSNREGLGQPPYTGRPQEAKKKKSFLPLAITLLVLIALVGGMLWYMASGSSRREAAVVEAAAYRQNVNRFRTAGRGISDSLVSLFGNLKSIQNIFVGTDQMAFLPEVPASPFIDMEEDWDYTETQHPLTMGRVVIPRLRTNAPLADECTEASLLWGFGRVPFWDDLGDYGDGGMVSLYGHRILTKPTGMLNADQTKEGDVFWIDDYRSGKRYIYTVEIIDHVTEDRHINYNMAIEKGYEPIQGDPSVMLVVCDPPIYGAEEYRIDTYGRLTGTLDIPEDDPYYQRYRGEHA